MESEKCKIQPLVEKTERLGSETEWVTGKSSWIPVLVSYRFSSVNDLQTSKLQYTSVRPQSPQCGSNKSL